MQRKFQLTFVIISILAISFSAFAHGTSLKVDKASAAAGEVITLKGEGITVNGEIRLSLTGLQDYNLGTAKGDEHGTFQQQITLPADVKRGDYLIVAEGEKRATAKLKIVAGQPGLPPATQQHQQTGMHDMEGTEAKAGPMEAPRATGKVETIARWSVVLVSVVLGLALRRGKSRRSARHSDSGQEINS